VSEGSHGLVIQAVREAAKRLGLSASWLDESVAMRTRPGEGHVDRVLIGLYPSPERFGLRVLAAKPAYILAMKLKALLSSEPKCNTPADLIIGTVDQDLRECCHARLFAFVG
jgi:hypothetical protein